MSMIVLTVVFALVLAGAATVLTVLLLAATRTSAAPPVRVGDCGTPGPEHRAGHAAPRMPGGA